MNLIKSEENRVEIPVNKLSFFISAIIALTLVIGGIILIVNPSLLADNRFSHTPKSVVIIIGWVAVAFFGMGAFIFIAKIFDSAGGLIIDTGGVTVNPGSAWSHFIEWAKIERFELVNVPNDKVIMIYLKDPQAFINTINDLKQRTTATLSLSSLGTPISFSTRLLKYDANDLLATLNSKLNS